MQYGSFQVSSARRLVGRAEAWVLFGLERVGKTLGVIWGRCTASPVYSSLEAWSASERRLWGAMFWSTEILVVRVPQRCSG
jgi:hypothetical protein